MFTGRNMPGLGAPPMVSPSALSSGLARMVSYIQSQGGADAVIAKGQAALVPQPNSVNANYAAQQAAGAPGIAPAAFPYAPSTGPSIVTLAMYGVGGLAAVWLLMKLFRGGSPAPLPVHQNPARRRNPERVPVVTRADRLKKAVESYESFHWGDKPSKFVAKKVSKPPKVGVKLGKLVSVAYETHKNGEHAIWEHEFGEEGGKRPDLVMDADNKRLHIVGGSYDVRPEGIID